MPKNPGPLLKRAACLYFHLKGAQPNESEHQNNFFKNHRRLTHELLTLQGFFSVFTGTGRFLHSPAQFLLNALPLSNLLLELAEN